MENSSIVFEPSTIFGLSFLEAFAFLMLFNCITVALYLFWRYLQPPYRVVLKTDIHINENPEWVLERRTSFFVGDWEPVMKSTCKHKIQTQAKEALFAHNRFRDFINQRDGELIRDNQVISDDLEAKQVG